MARSAADRDAAIAKARDVFWRTGYEDASIEDIVSATGFNRYALYSEFGGKRDLFLHVLDAYHVRHKTIFMGALADARLTPFDALRRVFEFSIKEMSVRGAGCLMCNIGGDVARTDPIVAQRIKGYVAEITWAFEQALIRAAEREELNPTVTPSIGADLLVTLIMGLGMRAEHGATRKELIQHFNAGMAALTGAAVFTRH